MTLSLTKKETIAGWIYMALQTLVIPVIVVLVCMIAGIYSDSLVNIICYVINAVCCLVIFWHVLGQSLGNIRGRLPAFCKSVLMGFAGYYLCAMVIGNLIMTLWPDFTNVNDGVVFDMIEQTPVLMTFAILVLVPFAEECLFRGLIFVPLARKNLALGYTVTTLVFALAHVVGYIGYYDGKMLAIGFLQYLPSFALCWACQKSDSLLAPMVVHMMINSIGVLAGR